jgi:hypothetical protein
MLNKIFALTALVLLAASAQKVDPPCPTIPLKKFKINMDLPIGESHKEMAIYAKPFVINMSEHISSLLRRAYLPEFVIQAVGNLGLLIDPVKDASYIERIKVFSEHSGVPLYRLYLVNSIYEYLWCTSIVLRNAEGQIMHGRNLDFFFTEQLELLFFDVEYYKGGKL